MIEQVVYLLVLLLIAFSPLLIWAAMVWVHVRYTRQMVEDLEAMSPEQCQRTLFRLKYGPPL